MASAVGVGEAVRFGWEKFKASPWLLIKVYVVVALVSILPSIVGELLGDESALVAFLLVIFGMVVQIIVSAGVLKFLLAVVDGKTPGLEMVFSTADLFVKIVAGSILYGLVVFLGILLLVVPGIIWAIKYEFFLYFIVDKQMGVFEAFHASGEATTGNRWRLLILGLVLGLIQMLGVLALGVGLLVTAPVTAVAMAYVYRKLTGGAGVAEAKK